MNDNDMDRLVREVLRKMKQESKMGMHQMNQYRYESPTSYQEVSVPVLLFVGFIMWRILDAQGLVSPIF